MNDLPWCDFYTKDDPRTDVIYEDHINLEVSPDNKGKKSDLSLNQKYLSFSSDKKGVLDVIKEV